MGESGRKFEIIHDTLNKRDNVLSVAMLCDIVGVSCSGYYRWVSAEAKRNEKEEQDRADFEIILEEYMHRGNDKGVRGIYMTLLHQTPPIIMNVKKNRGLMKNMVWYVQSGK